MQPDRPEPFFNIPAVVLGTLAVMAVIQLWRGTLSAEADLRIVADFAFVPGRLTFAFDPVGVLRHVSGVGGGGPANRQQAALAGLFLQLHNRAPWTVLTYALLHGGWAHLTLNGVWMVAFGTPVARRFGAGRFLLLMAAAAIWGALTHWLFHIYDFAPVVGASAAISGLMGTAVRFMFQFDRPPAESHRAPPMSLSTVFRDRRALSFILVWFVTNSVFGAGSIAFGLTDAPVAWQAHVGGFVAGLLLFPWFDPAGVEPAPDSPAREDEDETAPVEATPGRAPPPAAR